MTRAKITLPLLFVFAAFCSAPVFAAAESAESFDAAADNVLRDARYGWALGEGEEIEDDEPDNWFVRQIKSLREYVIRKIEAFAEWLRKLLRPESTGTGSSSGVGADTLRTWIIALSAAAAALLVALFVRSRIAAKRAAPAPAPVNAAKPDADDMSVSPDDFPEDEWLALAERLAAEGDVRKALRAMFLALLARLARFGLIAARASKSNSDYMRELRRRAEVGEAVKSQFRVAARTYESVWFGDHSATDASFADLNAALELCRDE